MVSFPLSLLSLCVGHFLWQELCLLGSNISMLDESSDVFLGGGGMLVPQRKKVPFCDTHWGTCCGI